MEVILKAIRWLSEKPDYADTPPSVLHTKVCQIAEEVTGNSDPFLPVKKTTNEHAMEVVPILKKGIKQIEGFNERFKFALKSTICGNAIDFEVEEHEFDPEDLKPFLMGCLEGGLSIDDVDKLMDILNESENVLYLLDNAGEIVFDKFLINLILQKYPCELTAVVKEAPVLNDATMDDAKQVSLSDLVRVVTTGTDYIGVNLEESSEEFLDLFNSADLIIAKGQGCYESLTEISVETPICYVLKAKCVEVAKDLGVSTGENVVKIV